MTKIFSSTLMAAIAVTLAALFPSAASAQFVYTSGHGDLRVSYDSASNEFIPHIHMDGDTTYLADEIVMWTDARRTTVTNNAASAQRFSGMLGIGAGDQIWVLGGNGVGPYLGFSGEGLDEGDWVHTFTHPEWPEPVEAAVIHMELTGWTMPEGAEFGLFQTAGLSSSWGNRASGEVVFSSYDPDFTVNNNRMSVAIGDHTHYAFGFTKPGTYELELTFSSVYKGGTPVSTTETFSFHVVPEPSSFVLIAVSGIVLLVFFRRKRIVV